MKILTRSLEETDKVAKDFKEELLLLNNDGAVVVGLSGDLGSGKTTFSQALGKHFGVTDFMTSPTFVIEKVYPIRKDQNKFTKLIHIDAYRLEKGQELEVLGFKELLKERENLILVEWPEKVGDILPDDLLKINFKFISENEREIEK